MKLYCNVEVHNRALPALKKKSQRSLLTISKEPDKNDLFIGLQTLQNKQGIKYKISDNLEKVFIKFINNGKATIRFKEPCHDLFIQSEALQLKCFFQVLKREMSKKVDHSVPVVSNLNPKNVLTIPGNKVVIKKKAMYPTLEGFPRTTEELFLIGLNKSTFDRQILKLQNLKVLNISNNRITSVPMELGSLPCIQELILSKNKLGNLSGLSKRSGWTWLEQPALRRNLCLLDLSDNHLTVLPDQIGKLSALITLKINRNSLVHLPQSIGILEKLKYLDVSKNNLRYLPGTLRNTRLLSLDISHNEFSNHLQHDCLSSIKVPSLVEWSARCFLKSRRMYDASLIPFTMVTYLDKAKYCCICGGACFDYYINRYMHMRLNDICYEVKMTQHENLLFDCYFCSTECSRERLHILLY